MNNGQIFDLVNIIIRKETEGDTITPAHFSELLYMASESKFNIDYEYYEQSRVISDSLRSLKASTTLSFSSGTVDFISAITSDSKTYIHAIGMSTSSAKFEQLTDLQFLDYKYSDLLAPTVDWPVFKIAADVMTVLPNTIAEAEFEYFQKPNIPFYDYYIDANDNYVYLTEGEVYTLQTGETYTDKETGATLTAGQSIGTKPTNDANNLSKEMSYPENERIQVIYMILEKLGIILNEQDAVQYGLMKENKEETT